MAAAATVAKSLQSCPTLCDPIDCSPPGSPIPGILQARTLGVGCHFLLQCMKVKSESYVRPLGTPWTAAYQAPLSMGFSRQEYWSGVPLQPPSKGPMHTLSVPPTQQQAIGNPHLCQTLLDTHGQVWISLLPHQIIHPKMFLFIPVFVFCLQCFIQIQYSLSFQQACYQGNVGLMATLSFFF